MTIHPARDSLDVGRAAAGEPLPLPPRSGPHLIVFRGELRGPTGYGAHIRALAAEVALHMDVAGVEIHFSATSGRVEWPYPTISDTDLQRTATQQPGSVVVVNFTTPNNYLYVEGAVNVGVLTWETNTLPRLQDWPEHIHSMDHMVVPNTTLHEMLQTDFATGPVDLIAWPHDFSLDPSQDLSRLDALHVEIVDIADRPARTLRLADLRSESATLFTAVHSLAPRWRLGETTCKAQVSLTCCFSSSASPTHSASFVRPTHTWPPCSRRPAFGPATVQP